MYKWNIERTRVSTKTANPCGILEGRGFDKSLHKFLQGFANPRAQIPMVFANFQILSVFEKGDLQIPPVEFCIQGLPP